MKKSISIQHFSRAFIVVAALMMLVGGVTFAALQSQLAIVQGNTIQTANADLKLSSNGMSFGRSIPGFSFDGLIPGGLPGPDFGHRVYLRNDGSTKLALRLSVNTSISNPDNMNLEKVKILITSTSGQLASYSMKELMDASTQGGMLIPELINLSPSQQENVVLQVQLDEDALSGPSATISNVNIVFGATAIS